MQQPPSAHGPSLSPASILSVDTSTKVCSVAIHSEGRLLASLETHLENSHAESLALMIEQVCRLAKVPLEQLSAFALSKGPGSYTGLRIGCSTVKGLCFAFEKPLITLSTLRIMAEPFLPFLEEHAFACSLLDARRMEVYAAVFDGAGESKIKEQAIVLDENSFSELLSHHSILFVGNGARKFQEIIKNANAKFSLEGTPLAKNMGGLAFQALQEQNFSDLAYFEPDYLKEFHTTAKIVSTE